MAKRQSVRDAACRGLRWFGWRAENFRTSNVNPLIVTSQRVNAPLIVLVRLCQYVLSINLQNVTILD
jgi:hypothetical protein